jgi:hypothetical protein
VELIAKDQVKANGGLLRKGNDPSASKNGKKFVNS